MLVVLFFLGLTLGKNCNDCLQQLNTDFCRPGSGYRVKNNLAQRNFQGKNCARDKAREACCDKVTKCGDWVCGAIFVDKPNRADLEFINVPMGANMNSRCCNELQSCATICPANERLPVGNRRCRTYPCATTEDEINYCCEPFCCGIGAAANNCCAGQTKAEAIAVTVGAQGVLSACCHQTAGGDTRPHITRHAGVGAHYDCKAVNTVLPAQANAQGGVCDGSAANALLAVEVGVSARPEEPLVMRDVVIIAATSLVVGGLYLSLRSYCLQGTPKHYSALLDAQEEA